jgi:hypothetical protein
MRLGKIITFRENIPYLTNSKQNFYVPASYIMYLSDFCRFLLCTCEWERRGRGLEKGRGIERGG